MLNDYPAEPVHGGVQAQLGAVSASEDDRESMGGGSPPGKLECRMACRLLFEYGSHDHEKAYPTPSNTVASSRRNTSGCLPARSNPFFSHPKRGWNVSWRANAGRRSRTVPSGAPSIAKVLWRASTPISVPPVLGAD